MDITLNQSDIKSALYKQYSNVFQENNHNISFKLERGSKEVIAVITPIQQKVTKDFNGEDTSNFKESFSEQSLFND